MVGPRNTPGGHLATRVHPGLDVLTRHNQEVAQMKLTSQNTFNI